MFSLFWFHEFLYIADCNFLYDSGQNASTLEHLVTARVITVLCIDIVVATKTSGVLAGVHRSDGGNGVSINSFSYIHSSKLTRVCKLF